MHRIASFARVAAREGGGGSAIRSAGAPGARPGNSRGNAPRHARRALLLSNREAIPTRDDKRYAAHQLGRAYLRIARDFNEAYEQCRSGAQRRALERAHAAAKAAALRAGKGEPLEDAGGWRAAQAAFDAARARTERYLASLEASTAVIRLRAKLAAI